MSTALLTALTFLVATLQPATTVRGRVIDSSGAAVPEAIVTLIANGQEQTVAVGGDGTFTVPVSAGRLRVRATGFADAELTVPATADDTIEVVLQPATFADTVVVTSDR